MLVEHADRRRLRVLDDRSRRSSSSRSPPRRRGRRAARRARSRWRSHRPTDRPAWASPSRPAAATSVVSPSCSARERRLVDRRRVAAPARRVSASAATVADGRARLLERGQVDAEPGRDELVEPPRRSALRARRSAGPGRRPGGSGPAKATGAQRQIWSTKQVDTEMPEVADAADVRRPTATTSSTIAFSRAIPNCSCRKRISAAITDELRQREQPADLERGRVARGPRARRARPAAAGRRCAPR